MHRESITITHFEELFHKHYAFLCLVSFQIVDNMDVAKDLAQEFYIDFWRRREAIQLSVSFQSYAVKAIKNLSISYLRKQEKQALSAIDHLVDDSYDPITDTEIQFDKEKLDSKVVAAIEKLPAACKQIFILYNVEGLSYAQIAAQLHISMNTVKTQMKRAYAMLRAELSDQSLVFVALCASLLNK